LFIFGCSAFTLAGLLDTAPADTSPTGGSSSTLKLVPDSANVLVSQQRKFTATGGAGGYSYDVQEGAAGGSIDSNGLYAAPAVPGTYTIVVTDSADAIYEATVMVTASIPLTITPVTITISAGATVAFTASGGISSYTYSASAGSINSGTGFYTAPAIAGSYPDVQTVHVTDGTSTADAVVTIMSPPSLQISPPTATLNAGSSYTFTASGGVPPYVYSATTGPINGATGQYGSGIAGSDTVRVTDAGGRTAPATVTIVALGGPLSINPSIASVDAGQTLSFTATGGTPSYTYSVSAGGGSVNSLSGLYTAPPFGGIATITVTDSVSATSTSSVTINAPAPLQIAPTSLLLATDGQTTFSATGGIPPYSYSVVAGGAGGTVNSVSGLYTAPGVEGSDAVRVTDAASHRSDAQVTVYYPLTIVPTDATVQQGDTYSFDASGGFPPYIYSVLSGPGSIDPDGTYHADGLAGSTTVKVVDSRSNSSTAAVTVTSSSAVWTIQGIDTSARSGQYASLALSPAGNHDPQIAYYESKNKELRLEKWNGTSWTRQTVESTGTIGQYASLALDAAANARISYYDASNKRLRYATWNGSWSKQTVDSGGNLGKYSSLALDSTGKPRISYYDSNNGDLKFASWNGSSWTKTPVDTAGDVGMYSSLALDAGGNPHISYYDSTNRRLKYVSRTGSSWGIPQIVDSGNDVGMYSSLALDGSGNPRISYYDNTGKDLKFASWNGSSWDLSTVDSAGDVGMYSSLALDGSGDPHISYYQNDAGNKHLKYAHWTGVWNIQTADPSSNVGMYSSLKLDASGKARIGYYNSSSQDLKCAKEQ
jgi:plastocyanin